MRHLSVEGLAEFLRDHPAVGVLDVRFAHEREAGHLPGDHHVPWLTPEWEPDPGFVDQVLRHFSPDDYVLVICRCGHRSSEAAELLEQAGFSHVYNVLGGYKDLLGKTLQANTAAGMSRNAPPIQEGLTMNDVVRARSA